VKELGLQGFARRLQEEHTHTISDKLKNAAEEVTGGFKEDQLAFGKARKAALRKNFGRGPKAPGLFI
jgi:hypothetical protein